MITTEWRNGYEDLTAAHRIRRVVFMEEQNVPEAVEFDGTDEACMHLILYCDGAAAATGRILWDDGDFVIGRVAVLPQYRKQKIGDFLMRLLIRKAFESGGARQTVHAQVAAQGFYEKLGFTAVGERYMEAGIPHIDMTREGDISCFC